MTHQDEDTRPTHPRTVSTAGGRTYRLVLSPRAMRAVTAAALANEDIASDCHRRVVHGETRAGLCLSLVTEDLNGPHAAGWSDYADAVAKATEVKL